MFNFFKNLFSKKLVLSKVFDSGLIKFIFCIEESELLFKVNKLDINAKDSKTLYAYEKEIILSLYLKKHNILCVDILRLVRAERTYSDHTDNFKQKNLNI